MASSCGGGGGDLLVFGGLDHDASFVGLVVVKRTQTTDDYIMKRHECQASGVISAVTDRTNIFLVFFSFNHMT
jgi:hypothetical protein